MKASCGQRNLKMVVSYDGTGYAGFQRQTDSIPTIQGTLERAILTLTGEGSSVTGAGRTDAGVHARGQVVNFHTSFQLAEERIREALNSMLPSDIVIQTVTEVNRDFNARFDAKNKTYSYVIFNSRIRPIFNRNYVYHYKRQLDLALMREATAFLTGNHDFRAFQAAGSAIKNTCRTIHFVRLEQTNAEISFRINADGFLYHMVRNIVGTLILVGNSKITPDGFRQIIVGQDRNYAGPTAPASGLCLEEVNY